MKLLPIPGYETKYLIRENGAVFSIKRDRYLVPQISKGYLRIELNDIVPKRFCIHRLVAMAFIKNEKNMPIVNHIDGYKLNNDYKNLEWTTASGNVIHAINNGLTRNPNGESNFNNRMKESEILEIRRLCDEGKYTQIEIGKMFNMDQRNISRIYKRKLWKHI